MHSGDMNRRPAYRGRAGAAFAIASSLLLVQCSPKEEAPAPAAPPPAAQPPEKPPLLPVPPPALTRADLLAAMNAAASDYAAGASLAGADPLVGRSFVVRLAFGCAGPGGKGSPGLAHWAPGAKGRTIELSLTPQDWTETPLIAPAVAAKAWEAAEGVWIERPWQLSDGCPIAAPVADDDAEPQAQAPAPASPQTMGIAAVFAPEGSRFGRRNGRPYAFTQRATGDQPATAPAKGYRVVLEGRLAAFPDGRAVNCRSEAPGQRPVCIAATQLDRVAFEDGDTGAQISEWRKD